MPATLWVTYASGDSSSSSLRQVTQPMSRVEVEPWMWEGAGIGRQKMERIDDGRGGRGGEGEVGEEMDK